MFRANDLLDLSQCPCPGLFSNDEYAWEALRKLPDFLKKTVKPARQCTILGTPFIAEDVRVGKGTVIEHGAVIRGPAIIGENCQIRSSGYIRGNVIVGDECVLGN